MSFTLPLSLFACASAARLMSRTDDRDSTAQPVIYDGGRFSVDNSTVPPSLILNSTWYREWASNGPESNDCPVTDETDVVVFTVTKPYGHPLGVALWQSWTALFQWLNFKVAQVAPKHMLDSNCGGRLRELGVKVFVMPGGDTQLYAGFTECRDHIQDFILAGGLFVGSCGGFAYLSSMSHNLKDETEIAFDFKSTYLDIIPAQKGPVWYLGKMSPLPGQTAADVLKQFGPYEKGPAVLAQLTDGLIGGYAGGFPASELPDDAEVFQRFSQVDKLPGGEEGQPMAAVHVHGNGRNALGFVYHPEFELGLPDPQASDTGLFARVVLQPGDTHDLPMLQLKMWRKFAEKLLSAMDVAKLPVSPSIKIPDTLRYKRSDGNMWKMVEGKNELVPEKLAEE